MTCEQREDDGDLSAVAPGLKVYDANGTLLGSVEAIDWIAGMMQVATNPFFEDPVVVPLCLVTAVNARELILSSTRPPHRTKETARRYTADGTAGGR